MTNLHEFMGYPHKLIYTKSEKRTSGYQNILTIYTMSTRTFKYLSHTSFYLDSQSGQPVTDVTPVTTLYPIYQKIILERI